MTGQITIWDLLSREEERDIESLTSADIAKIIGDAIGFVFTPSGWNDEYEVKLSKKKRLSVYKSHYACDVSNKKEGDSFISCGWSTNNSGCGSPIDSVDESISFFKNALKRLKGEK